MKNDRFVKVYEQGMVNLTEIWVDRVTGVHYLFHGSGNAGGMTPLLDEEGHVVISKPEERWPE